MPRLYEIQNQAFFDAVCQLVSSPNTYQNMVQLKNLKPIGNEEERLVKYLTAYYYSKYLSSPDYKPAADQREIEIKSHFASGLSVLGDFSEVLWVKGPAFSEPSQIALPKLPKSSWGYIFENYGSLVKYFQCKDGTVSLTAEADQYSKTLESPEDLIKFWTRSLAHPTGLDISEVQVRNSDFKAEKINFGKAGLGNAFEQYCLEAPCLTAYLVDAQSQLTSLGDDLWKVLLTQPEVYTELRISFISTVCYGLKHDKIMEQLAQGDYQIRTYLEYARSKSGPYIYHGSAVLHREDQNALRKEVIEKLWVETGVHSSLDEKDKVKLFSQVRGLFSGQELYKQAELYAAQDWRWFARVKKTAELQYDYEAKKYQDLELQTEVLHKNSWPTWFKKLETVVELIEKDQSQSAGAKPGKISETFSYIASAAVRVPGSSSVGGFIQSNTQRVSDNLDLHWMNTIKQLEALKSEYGFAVSGITSGPLKPVIDAFREESPDEKFIVMKDLPLGLAQRIEKICPQRQKSKNTEQEKVQTTL